MSVRADIGRILTDAFDAIYVINLPDRADRRAEMDGELARIGLSLDHPKLHLFAAIRPAEAAGWPTIGARGCFESHLGVLEDALAQGATSVLVLEDDVHFSDALLAASAQSLGDLLSRDWACLYGGPIQPADRAGPLVLTPLAPDQALIGLHFFALRAPFLQTAHTMLRAMRARPPGHPDGGPMHVDGGYNHIRQAHPDMGAVIVTPGIAHQRASRTDVHDLKWFDRLPVLRDLVGAVRRLRNAQR